MSIAVKEWKDDIIFLRKLIDGPANRSYGIQVGRLAGLPDHVVERAKGILVLLEAGHFDQLEADGEQKDAEAMRAEQEKARQARDRIDTSRPMRQERAELATAEPPRPPQVASPPAPGEPASPAPPSSSPAAAAPQPSTAQLSLFGGGAPSKQEQAVLDELRKVSVGNMTPIEALVMLDRLARELIS